MANGDCPQEVHSTPGKPRGCLVCSRTILSTLCQIWGDNPYMALPLPNDSADPLRVAVCFSYVHFQSINHNYHLWNASATFTDAGFPLPLRIGPSSSHLMRNNVNDLLVNHSLLWVCSRRHRSPHGGCYESVCMVFLSLLSVQAKYRPFGKVLESMLERVWTIFGQSCRTRNPPLKYHFF